MRSTRRAPRPRLPLFTGQALSAADYRAQAERAMSEREIQRALIAELRNPLATHGAVLAWHCPNGWWLPGLDSETSARVWKTLQADGALPGASDLIIGHNGSTLLLELKSATGKQSDAQENFERDAAAVGLVYRTASSLTEARSILRERGVLP